MIADGPDLIVGDAPPAPAAGKTTTGGTETGPATGEAATAKEGAAANPTPTPGAGGEAGDGRDAGGAGAREQKRGTTASSSSGTGSGNAVNSTTSAPACPIAVKIVRHRTRWHFDKKFIQYEISVSFSNMRWSVYRRYSEFEMLHRKILKDFGGGKQQLPKLPGKRWSGNLDPLFLVNRRQALDKYFRKLMEIPAATGNAKVMEFLGMLSDHSSESKRKRLQADLVCRIVKPGDIVLFRTQGTLPALQRTVLNTEYDHVGIVITKHISRFSRHFDAAAALFLLESTNEGVHAYPLRSRLRAWHLSGAIMVVRRLKHGTLSSGEVAEVLQDFAGTAEGKGYGLNPIKLLRRKAENAPLETYFCSELVASAYKKIGVLPESVAASNYYPSTFAARSGLKLTNDAELSDEVMIEFWQPEVLRARLLKNRSKSVGRRPCEPTTNASHFGGRSGNGNSPRKRTVVGAPSNVTESSSSSAVATTSSIAPGTVVSPANINGIKSPKGGRSASWSFDTEDQRALEALCDKNVAEGENYEKRADFVIEDLIGDMGELEYEVLLGDSSTVAFVCTFSLRGVLATSIRLMHFLLLSLGVLESKRKS